MTPFRNRLTTGLAALAASVMFASCENSKTASYESGVVDYTSPNTKMSKEEFPFDDNGNYREDWAARGAGVYGVKDKPTDTALYTQNSDNTLRDTASSSSGPINHPAYVSEGTPSRTTTFSSSSQSGSGSRSASVRRTTSSPSRSTASRSSGSSTGSKAKSKTSTSRSTASKAKPRPKPKAKPSSTTVKVKSSDTLYGLSKKHGVSVSAIKAANGLKGDTIVDGKSLKIPKKK